jgi:hypothetical protein
MTGPIVQIFNRAPWPLKAIKDGRTYDIPVGFSHMTADVVPFAKLQNPLMGSEDPNTLQFESLISVVIPAGDPKRVQRDPLDALPAEVIRAMPIERINRSLLDPSRQATEERATQFPRGRVGVEAPTEGFRDLIQKGGD